MSAFAAYLFSNNAQVSILAFALGFAFGIPSLMLLVHNTAVLGAMLWLYHGAGLTLDFAAWLSIHGTTELFAILLSGAAGLHIGRSMAFPGTLPELEAAAAAGRRAAASSPSGVLAGCASACDSGRSTSLGRLPQPVSTISRQTGPANQPLDQARRAGDRRCGAVKEGAKGACIEVMRRLQGAGAS